MENRVRNQCWWSSKSQACKHWISILDPSRNVKTEFQVLISAIQRERTMTTCRNLQLLRIFTGILNESSQSLNSSKFQHYKNNTPGRSESGSRGDKGSEDKGLLHGANIYLFDETLFVWSCTIVLNLRFWLGTRTSPIACPCVARNA